MASPSTAAVVQPLNIDMGDTMTLTPVEVETARQAREEKLLGFDYMPAFLCPKPVQYEKYWSPRAARTDTDNPYKLRPKHSLESSYLTSYKPAHVQEMYQRISAGQSAKKLVANRPQFVTREEQQHEATPRLRAALETFDAMALRERAGRYGLDLNHVDEVIESSTDPKLELIELILPHMLASEGDDGEKEQNESVPVDESATFRGLNYLPEPPKTTSAQFFKRRAGPSTSLCGVQASHGPKTDEFSNRTMTSRWQYAAEAREPWLKRLGYPFDKGYVVMVHREHCTAFVDVAPGMTPKQLVERMRNEPPAGRPFNRLRAGQFLGVPCFARLVRGPYILDEDKPLSAQQVGPNCNLALVYKEEHGTFDLIDPVLAERQRQQAKEVHKHFSRREEHKWGWIGQPDRQVLAQGWFQELLVKQQRVSEREALLRTASGMGLLHRTQSAALKQPGKKKGKKGKKGKKKGG